MQKLEGLIHQRIHHNAIRASVSTGELSNLTNLTGSIMIGRLTRVFGFRCAICSALVLKEQSTLRFQSASVLERWCLVDALEGLRSQA